MKTFINLLLAATTYTLTILVGVAMLCRYSVFKCELVGGRELIVMDWIIPAVIVSGGLLLVGMGVAYINFYLATHKQGFLKWSILRFTLGSAAGILPLVFWNILTESITKAYRPSLQEIPFLLGGIMVALLVHRKSMQKQINGSAE